MKRFAFFVTALLLAVVVCAQDIPDVPSPPRMVNDFTKELTSDQLNALETKLRNYRDSTSTEIAIVMLRTIGNNDPGDFATALGRKWEVGGKQFNNGIVILLVIDDRKTFIAVGYGLEKRIPDYTAKQIIDNDLIPHMKQQDPYGALDNTVDAIIKAAAGEYKSSGKKDGGGPSGFLIILVILIIVIAISRRGGGRGGMMSRRGYRGSSVPPIWWWPTGGSSGGGGWSGGGGGGGGFGGFGGGSFGGGGAGGSW